MTDLLTRLRQREAQAQRCKQPERAKDYRDCIDQLEAYEDRIAALMSDKLEMARIIDELRTDLD